MTQAQRVCPICGATYNSVPAVSRTDNETLICPSCGVRQSLKSLGCDAEEQEYILGLILSYTADNAVKEGEK